MLLFKKRFLPAIRSGEKTQTIRLWNCRRMRPGQRSYIPGVGYIHVTSVEAVQLDLLRDEDAIPDGFADAASLRRELDALYADQIAAGWQAYRIRFAIVPNEWRPEPAPANAAARSKRGPRETPGP
jgi:hypothetical protein